MNHDAKSKVPIEIPAELIERLMRPDYVGDDGLLVGRRPITAMFKGKRMVGVGNRIYSLDPDISFHQFIVMFFKDILGVEWGIAETSKPKDQQHPIIRWLSDLGDLVRDEKFEKGQIRQFEATGNIIALLTLAYDVYSIYLCAKLPEKLVARLRNPEQFQGAKYEIAVAGIFARAGFKIEWITETARKRPEFTATHLTTGEKIVVEAKSRHRQGVLTQPGKIDLNKMRGDVGTLLAAALEKEVDGLPYLILIDVNVPMTESENPLTKTWVKDAQEVVGKHKDDNAIERDPYTGLVLTNFSWHYLGTDSGQVKGESVLVYPQFPETPLKDIRTLNILFQATNEYGAVPGEFPKEGVPS